MTRVVTFSRADELAEILEVSTVEAPPEPGCGNLIANASLDVDI